MRKCIKLINILNILTSEYNLITNKNNQKLCIFLRVRQEQDVKYFSFSNISAITFQQSFSKNKLDEIIIYKV